VSAIASIMLQVFGGYYFIKPKLELTLYCQHVV